MENGRFTTIIVIVIALIGAAGYYGNMRLDELGAQIAQVRARTDDAATLADFARNAANEAKTAVATLAANSPKLGDIAEQVKQASAAAAAASQSATEAKEAAADVQATEKGHMATHRK